MKVPLASAMVFAANVAARSDNSLSNMLGIANIDLFLNLEQKQNEPQPGAASLVNNALEQSNDLEDNKISYTRHNYRDEYESESSDECPGCFTSMRDDGVPIRHEMSEPDHKHHHAYEKMQRYDDAFNTHSKYYDNYQDEDDINGKHKHYGESIMQDGPIRSEYGHGGKSSFGGEGRRHFSFDEMRRSPSARHYETKGHSFGRHYETEDLEADDEDEDEDDSQIIPRKSSKKKSKKSKKSKQSKDDIEEPTATAEKEPVATEAKKDAPEAAMEDESEPRRHRHRHHHHHHRNHQKNSFDEPSQGLMRLAQEFAQEEMQNRAQTNNFDPNDIFQADYSHFDDSEREHLREEHMREAELQRHQQQQHRREAEHVYDRAEQSDYSDYSDRSDRSDRHVRYGYSDYSDDEDRHSRDTEYVEYSDQEYERRERSRHHEGRRYEHEHDYSGYEDNENEIQEDNTDPTKDPTYHGDKPKKFAQKRDQSQEDEKFKLPWNGAYTLSASCALIAVSLAF